MDKKHITIIGSCVTRNLFNTTLLNNIFDIDTYICQVCEFALFDKGLNIPTEIIYKANIPDFTARCIDYELNKNTTDIIKNKKSEYVIIDLHNIYTSIFMASLDDFQTYVYTQSNAYTMVNSQKALNMVDELKNLKLREVKFKDFDKNIIKSGLISLAEFLKENFEEHKIIIHIPKRVEYFSDINNNIFKFDQSLIDEESKYDSIVFEFSHFLAKQLPRAKLFYNTNNTISKLIESNIVNGFDIPQSNHFSDYDNLNAAINLINLLGIRYECFYTQKIDPINIEVVKLSNLAMKNLKSFLNINKNGLSLNNYFDKIDNFEDFIFIISAKDEASKNIKYFRNKSKLGITCSFNLRDSYIAIIDKSRNFIYENSSQEKLSYKYTVNDSSIHIQSAGFDAGNISSVKIDTDEKNLSPNKRGLNIVVLNAKTLEVVDQAHCDTYIDKDLNVDSYYFKNVKLKI